MVAARDVPNVALRPWFGLPRARSVLAVITIVAFGGCSGETAKHGAEAHGETTLGNAGYALIRGHGSLAVGQSIRQVVYRAIYAELNAKLQSEAAHIGDSTCLNDAEAANAAATNDEVLERPWELWKKRVT